MTRLHVPVPLRWADQDAYGHVNNVAVMRLVEEARVRTFWRSPDAAPFESPMALLDLGAASGVLSLVARVETEYAAPMPYSHEPLDVEVWIGRVGGASFEICFELYSPIGVNPRVLYARSSTSIVTVSAETGQPVRLPPEVVASWRQYREDPPRFTRR